MLAFAGCSAPVASDLAGDASQGSTTESRETTRGDAGDSSTIGGSSTTDDGGGFIVEPDAGGLAIECDIWAQDCPADQKCMPWANDRSDVWNATRCTPVDRTAAQPGDACTVEGSGTSGIDDCELGAMCWDVDDETLIGTCVAFCMGSPAAPVCVDPSASCILGNGGVLVVCLPSCDPLLQPCPEGQACYPISGGFVCGPDASDALGAYGDPCAFVNGCDPGLFCAGAELVPSCRAGACCSPYCDAEDPDATAACPGAADGQQCTAWFEVGEAPPGLENVGACAVPQ